MRKLLLLCLFSVLGYAQQIIQPGGGSGSAVCSLTGTQTNGYVLTATDGGTSCSWQTVGAASVDANTIKNAIYIAGGGSANAITGTTGTTFPGAYAAGQGIIVKVAATNTGATTININSLGNKNVTKNGATALAAGNLVNGNTYLLVYDGTQFQVANFTVLAADIPTLNQSTSGNAATATALAANGTNCSAGQFPLGVDASGNSETCTALPTTIAGTANQITASASTGAITLSIPSSPTLPGTTTGTFSGNITGNVTGNASGTAANVTGVVAEANGGTGANNTVGAAGHVLRSNATHYVDSAIQAGDVPTLNQNTSGTAANLSGTPALPNGTTATTQSANSNDTKLATDAYVDTGLSGKAASNASTTVNGQTCTLGSTCTIAAGGSVFTGSTGTATSSSATPTFSLADVSTKSPIIFTISPVVNVTGPSITNLSAGAHFFIRVTSDGTHTWNWNGVVTNQPCKIVTDIATTTTAELQVESNGTTIDGLSCQTSITGNLFTGPVGTAPSVTPGTSGDEQCNTTSSGVDCLYSDGTHHITIQSGGDISAAGVVSKINGTTFSGTNGDLVTFGASNTPADSGILATNAVRKDAANTGAAAMTLDMSGATGATALKVPVIAGATAGADGVIDYDSTAKITHVRTNGADSDVAATTATSTNVNQVLHATAVAGVYASSAIVNGDITNSTIDLTTKVTGTLPVANGGTGITSFGTGVATALGTAVSGSGAICLATASACAAGGGATGTSITNTTPVTVNANSTAEQFLMELAPAAGYFNSSGQPFLINGAFVYTTPAAQTPTITINVRLCTVSGCGSGTNRLLAGIVTTATIASVTNNSVNVSLLAINHATGATGTLEVHGPLSVDLGALTTTADSIFNDVNTAVSGTIDLTAALFVDFSVTFSTNAAGANAMTQRSGSVMPFAAMAAPVTSFSGDGTLISNSSSTGAVTATLATAAAHKFWMNNTGSTAAPGYQTAALADLPGTVVNATSPGAGIAHFAGSTQTVTSSPIVNADVTSIDAASKLTGLTPVANGGTGLGTLTAHALYAGNGTSAPTALAVGATNTVLHGSTGADPSYSAIVNGDITNSTIDLTAKVTGTLPLANGGTNGTDAADNGGMVYSNASGLKILAHTTVDGRTLISKNATTPSWGGASRTVTGTDSATSADCGNAINSTSTTNFVETLPQATGAMGAGCVFSYTNGAKSGIITFSTTTSVFQGSGYGNANFFLGPGSRAEFTSNGTDWVVAAPTTQILCDAGFASAQANSLSSDAGTYFGHSSTAATTYANFGNGECILPASLINSAYTLIDAKLQTRVVGSNSPNYNVGLKLCTVSGCGSGTSTVITQVSGGGHPNGTFTGIYDIQITGTAAAGASVSTEGACIYTAIATIGTCANVTVPGNSAVTNGILYLTSGAFWSANTAGNAIELVRQTVTLFHQ